ncbi:hypothetical protein HMPREF1342_02277 [Enterococcus faecalis ERV85]|nr:hypothetical protein HMPREF9492_01660 [Enterococcus faecalis DAPTO 512]EJU99453.1 hypothetical protein HMPREF1332_01090 [Enterococcus faecalis ERV31]EJV32854.1 hypothetical protein HMPREF1342_02277 [Enterococcus faecalis ERV85]
MEDVYLKQLPILPNKNYIYYYSILTGFCIAITLFSFLSDVF